MFYLEKPSTSGSFTAEIDINDGVFYINLIYDGNMWTYRLYNKSKKYLLGSGAVILNFPLLGWDRRNLVYKDGDEMKYADIEIVVALMQGGDDKSFHSDDFKSGRLSLMVFERADRDAILEQAGTFKNRASRQ